jgi:D-alanyl-lipoteichoic acid acyltransferase DltB (MBOAT superfamily)
MPIVVCAYYLINHAVGFKYGKYWIIVASIFFAGYSSWHTLLFLVFSIVFNYICACGIKKNKNKALVALAVIMNIVALGYYKYADFLSLPIDVSGIIVPLGISFITFQQISFIVDVYSGKIHDIFVDDYIFYVMYFPKLVQGPITRYDELIKQLLDDSNKNPNAGNLANGFWTFTVGLAKKVLVADVLSVAVRWGYGEGFSTMSALDAIIVALCFTFQIYFDFGGYSNMAIGISKMLNIDVANNFAAPYKSKSIIEFWKRWHISLTDFLREYIYFPLGGSRKGKIRSYFNSMVIFLVSGLWHGSAWNFIAWGGLHGAAYCLNKLFYKQWEKLNAVFRWFMTFIYINVSWVFFRASTVEQAVELLGRIVKMERFSISEGLINCFKLSEISFIAGRIEVFSNFILTHSTMEMWIFLAVIFIISLCANDCISEKFKPTVAKCIGTIIMFSWSIVSLSNVAEFIYGNF